MELETPVVLARLPRTSQDKTPTKFAHIYSVRAGQKRKRQEICTATDGDAVNIYKVQDGQILTSYPVPPAAAFTCQPYSFFTERVAETPSLRKTYCALKHNSIHIQSFTEEPQQDQLASVDTATIVAGHEEHSIIHLSPLLREDTTQERGYSHEVIAVRENGLLQIFSEDLKREIFSAQLDGSKPNGKVKVLQSQLISNSLLTACFVKYDGDRDVPVPAEFGVWLLERGSSAPGMCPPMTRLLLCDLPHSSNWVDNTDLEVEFENQNCVLSVRSGQDIILYDLCSVSPRILSELSLENNTSSIIMLSSSLLAGSDPHSIKIYDTELQSIQASMDLEKAERKRRRGGDSRGGAGRAIRLVAFFARTGRILGLRRRDLIALDVKSSSSQNWRKLAHGKSLLINSLGRGAVGVRTSKKGSSLKDMFSFGKVGLLELGGKHITALRQTLDQLAKAGAVAKFEDVVAEVVQYPPTSRMRGHPDDLGLPSKVSHALEPLLRYVVSKIFVWVQANESESEGHLVLAFPALRLIPWLGLHGYLRCSEIEVSLASAMSVPKTMKIVPGMVLQALLAADPSFRLLDSYIRGIESLGLFEISGTVKWLLDQAIAQSEQHNTTLKTKLDQTDNMTIDQPSEATLTEERPADRRETQLTISTGGFEPSAVEDSLTLSLKMLSSFPVSQVSAQLRSSLWESQILALIQLLRQHLFHGGYTHSLLSTAAVDTFQSSHAYSATEQDPYRKDVLPLNSIVKLLSGCIDAIGPVGFVMDGDQDDFINTVIPELNSEVARAMEAIENATYLQGILREVVRYADSISRDEAIGGIDLLRPDGQIVQQAPGSIVTIYAEPALEQGDTEATAGVLPLSLRAEDLVSKTKVRKGGGQVRERRHREILGLQARQRGRYSFERLVL